jgi:aminoglycoside 6'-N-acetyltransferase I
MRLALWTELSVDEDRQELDAAFSGKPMGTMPLTILVAETGDGDLVGFLEVGLRSHADGCDTRVPVGFVEGWFVSELHRGCRREAPSRGGRLGPGSRMHRDGIGYVA